MSGLQPIEPMYSFSFSKGTAMGSHYCFAGKRIIETKHFTYCTKKKCHFQEFHFVPEKALNLVKTMELTWVP